jgi:uncharacterized protein YndB with AHSA1/START domain
VADYERSLTVAAPLPRVWRAFTEPEDLRAWHGNAIQFEAREGGRVLFRDEGYPEVSGHVMRMLAERLLQWEVDGTQIQITEEFVPSGTGTTVAVRQQGGPALAGHERQAYALGWDEALADMALLVEYGIRYPRHMSPRSSLGAQTQTMAAGVRVVSVSPGSYAEQAGLRPGDLLVRLGAAPLFSRADVALVTREHPPGTPMQATYVRAGQLLTGTAALSSRV